MVSAHEVQAGSVYGYRSVCGWKGGSEEGWLCPRFCVIYIFLCMHCLHCHFRSTRKLGLQIYFWNGPRGSLKRALECQVQILVGYFLCWCYSTTATIKILTAQHRISARYHLSDTDVKARVNNWQLVHICEHVAASKVASFLSLTLWWQ